MSQPAPSGTWTQRWLVRVFTLLFGVLSYWLIGFLLEDIRDWPGPDYQALESQMIPQDLRQRSTDLKQEAEKLQVETTAQQSRQSLLRDSANNAQTTMNQLLEFQRLSLDKGMTPSAAEQSALAESQQRFLANQAEYQRLNEDVARLQENRLNLESRQRAHEAELRLAEAPVFTEYQRLLAKHQTRMAWAQLGVLTPLLIIGLGLFLKFRESLYVPLYLAFAIAVAAKALRVMHQYFPAQVFKYVLVVVFLVIVSRALVLLIRAVAHPRRDVLLKRFREAYETFLCPICEFPIRRGPRKHLYWTRRTVKKLALPTTIPAEQDKPYCCPSCSTQLFVECPDCHAVRHSLLPTCEHCGATAAGAA